MIYIQSVCDDKTKISFTESFKYTKYILFYSPGFEYIFIILYSLSKCFY